MKGVQKSEIKGSEYLKTKNTNEHDNKLKFRRLKMARKPKIVDLPMIAKSRF